jgi:glycosyltransferase involved in cell wall biosynthesis
MTVAVLIPCHNEELTVAQVVADCRKYCPKADVFVFDNCSTDRTAEFAFKAGAQVIAAPRRGKANAVKQAFASVEADIYVLVDGDGTYSLEHLQDLIAPVESHSCDMVVAARLANHSHKAFRRFHLFGNRFFSGLVSFLFGQKVSDILSGYRVFSKNFVQSLSLQSGGFELETELTLHAISRNFIVQEIPLPYRERPEGSFSKLKTFGDGFLILKLMARLIRDYKPLPFFSALAFACFFLGLISGWAPIHDYIEFAYVYTVPRAILAAGLMILSTVFFGVGLIMDSQVRLFHQQMQYLHSIKMQKATASDSSKKIHAA